MDRSLSVESIPLIDFGNTRDENVDETSGKGYVDYFEENLTDVFNIPDYNFTDEDQHSICSNNESDNGINESDVDEKRK